MIFINSNLVIQIQYQNISIGIRRYDVIIEGKIIKKSFLFFGLIKRVKVSHKVWVMLFLPHDYPKWFI